MKKIKTKPTKMLVYLTGCQPHPPNQERHAELILSSFIYSFSPLNKNLVKLQKSFCIKYTLRTFRDQLA